MDKQVYQFKTNINCGSCVRSVPRWPVVSPKVKIASLVSDMVFIGRGKTAGQRESDISTGDLLLIR